MHKQVVTSMLVKTASLMYSSIFSETSFGTATASTGRKLNQLQAAINIAATITVEVGVFMTVANNSSVLGLRANIKRM